MRSPTVTLVSGGTVLAYTFIFNRREPLREDTHKKVFFLVVGPLRFYPPYTNGLVVHATFFFFFF